MIYRFLVQNKNFYGPEAHVEASAWNPEGRLSANEHSAIVEKYYHRLNMILWNNSWM
jgi:hypothetical protein